MAIHAISGKPGGGKTMYAVKLILHELLYGSRVIITNLPLHLGEWNVKLQAEAPNKVIDLHYRLRIIDEAMTSYFWTYRPEREGYGWVRIPVLSEGQWRAKEKPSYVAVEDMGVMYVIDECHNFFNARAWAETGRDVLFYLSQHRHLGDTVVWVTQAIMNVDKQFRSVTQDYTYMRNLSKEKHGLFTLPAYFVRKTFGEPAGPNSVAMESGTFKLDVTGLGSLYSTAAGVGIHDRGQGDMSERKRGIPWWVLGVSLPLVVLLLVWSIPKFGAWWFDPMRHGAGKALARVSRGGVSAPVSALEFSGASAPISSAVGLTNVPVVSMTGYSVAPRDIVQGFAFGKRVTVFLSDGSRWFSGDGHLQFLSERFCVVDGHTNWLSVPVSSPATELPPVVASVVSQSGPSYEVPSYGDDSGGSMVWKIPARGVGMFHPQVRSSMQQSQGGY
jgi:hypothetical protein